MELEKNEDDDALLDAGVRRVGLTRTLVISITVAALGSSFQFGFGTGVMNNSEKFIMDTFHNQGKEFTIMEWGFVVSSYGLGGLIGASFFATLMMANMGRRMVLVASNFFVFLSSALIAFAPNWWTMALGRVSIGIVAGVGTACVPTYFSEISPIEVRGAVGTVHQLFITIGILIAQALSTPSLGLLGSTELWQWLFLVPAAAGLVEVIILPFCPESPSYLFITSGEKAAADAFKWLQHREFVGDYIDMLKEEIEHVAEKDASGNIDVKGTLSRSASASSISSMDRSASYNDLLSVQEQYDTAPTAKLTISGLFADKSLKKQLVVGIVCELMMQLSGIDAVLYYSTSVFKSAGVTDPELATTLLGAVNVAMTIVAVKYMDVLGRRSLLLLSWVGMCSSYTGLALTFIFKDLSPTWMPMLGIAAMTGVIIFFAIGPGCIAWFIIAEIFPMRARDQAMSIGITINWVANWAVAFSFPILMVHAGRFTFLVWMSTTGFFGWFTYMYVPETKGKQIMEVQADFETMTWKNGIKSS